MNSALTRYRIIAYVVGVGLLVLVLIAVPLKYIGGDDTLVAIVGPIHGFLFIVYLLCALDLAVRCRWPLVKAVVIMAAGTIPFMSFICERRVTREVRARAEAAAVAQPASPTTSPG